MHLKDMASWRARLEKFVRPSTLTPQSLCQGYALMNAIALELYGEEAEDPAASVGTLGHAAIAQARTYGKLAIDWPGLDEFTKGCAQRGLDWLRDLIAALDIEPSNVLVEHHLAGNAFGLPRGGTADIVLLRPFEKAWIIDWKFTYNEQDAAPDHDQLSAYARAAADTFKVDDVEVILYCAREDKAHRITRASFNADALRSTGEWIADVTARSREQLTAAANGMALELVAGYEQCKHCRALPICKTARKFMSDAVELAQVMDPETPNEWGALADAMKVADVFAEKTKDMVKRHIAGGGLATGWKLQPGAGMTVIDAAKAISLANMAGELPALLTYAKFSSEAAEVLESISGAVSVKAKAPSLRPSKGA